MKKLTSFILLTIVTVFFVYNLPTPEELRNKHFQKKQPEFQKKSKQNKALFFSKETLDIKMNQNLEQKHLFKIPLPKYAYNEINLSVK